MNNFQDLDCSKCNMIKNKIMCESNKGKLITKNRNFIEKTKKMSGNNPSSSLCLQNVFLSSSSDEGIQNNSSEELMKVFTTSANKNNEAQFQTDSVITSYQEKEHSLDLILDLRDSSTNSQNSLEKSVEDSTFEEVLNKMLTPDLVPVEKQSSYLMKNKQLINSSYDNRKKSDEMTFEEILEKMLTKTISGQNPTLSNEVQSKESQIMSQCENDSLINNNLMSRNEIEQNISGINPLSIDTTVEDTNTTTNSIEFDEMLTQFLNPSVPENITLPKKHNQKLQKNFKDMCTQTSFDEFDDVKLNYFSIRHEENSQSYPKKNITNRNNKPVKIKNAQGQNKKSKHLLEKLSTSNDQQNCHILDILSRDITILPDDLKFFNNIDKIGTSDWLQSAINASNNLNISKSKGNLVQIDETKNVFSMYTDNLLKKEIKRFQKGDTKIYKIEKNTSQNGKEDNIPLNFNKDSLFNVPKKSKVDTKLRIAIDEICNNKQLINNNFNNKIIDSFKIRTKIHDIFSTLYEIFDKKQNPCLVIKQFSNRKNKGSCTFKDGRHQPVLLNQVALKKISFKNRQTRSNFCRLLYLMAKVYSLLENNTKLTKREIFYQCKHLIRNQVTMDRCILEVTNLLGIGHWHLNIFASTGLVYGNLKITWASGEVTNCNTSATTVPYNLEEIVEVHSTACFILIVEKESIFRKLLDENIPNKLARPFIIITGKGMPACNTRLFVNKLSTIMSIPVFIFVDPDIHGIKIMLTYRFGSIRNCFLYEELAVPNALWLGVFPSEITKYGMKQQKLTRHDQRTVTSLLKYPVMDSYPRIVEEIKILSESGMKGSIEGLIKTNTFLTETYLPMKFFNKDFI